MHASDPLSLPDVDTGLHVVRWKVCGFDEMRRVQLLDRRCSFELVDGMVLHREAGSRRHDRVVSELARRLERQCELQVAVGRELRFEDHDSVVTPDIVVGGDDGEPPDLIVEVSEDAPRLDAQEKPRLYARAGVATYWHVDLAWRFVQMHASPYPDGDYGMRASGTTGSAAGVPRVGIRSDRARRAARRRRCGGVAWMPMAIHVDPSVPLRPISVSEFFRMGEAGVLAEDEKVELLRGAIVEVSPPSPEHDDAIEWLTLRLVPLALAAGLSVRVQSTMVFVETNSVPLPDLVILERSTRRRRTHPTTAYIAIEVSVSSLRIDTRLKAGIYAEAGIPEYWVVDIRGRRILRHAEPSADGYAVVEQLGPDDKLRTTAVPGFPALPVGDILDGEFPG